MPRFDVTAGSKQNVYSKTSNIITAIPQVIAALIAAMTHAPVMGFSLGYSAVLISQLEECQSPVKNCSNSIIITEAERPWIASIYSIFIPIGAVIGSTLMDTIGRLNLLVLAILPSTVGWTIIALGSNITMVLIGRILISIASGWTTCSALVFIAEVTNPKLRGSMGSLPAVYVSLGIALVYTTGYLLHWRVIAWLCVAFSILCGVLIKFLPESPIWLISKGRIHQAEASLNWLNKYYSDAADVTKRQLEDLVKANNEQQSEVALSGCNGLKSKLGLFLAPTVAKPILILPFLNLFVQFSGVYVILFYATSFFQAAGTDINPYLAAMCFGWVRFVMAIFSLGLMQRFGRRPLIITSGLAMAVTMTISGTYTKWIQEGTSTQMWVPLVMISLYVIATMVGFLNIPLAIPAELFPTAMRGMAQSISVGILYGLSFLAIFSYYSLMEILGGSSGLQYFYAAVSIVGVLYSYILLPETHNKKLDEIEEYFKNHTVYLWYLYFSKKSTDNIV